MSPFSSQRASPFSRTKSGCAACKLRKKKCDERKPRCEGCQRNYLLCTWPSEVPGQGSLRRHDTCPKNHRKVEVLPAILDEEVSEHQSYNLQLKTNTENNAAELLILGSKNAPERASFSPSPNLLKPSEVFQATLSRSESRTLFQHYENRTADLLCASQGVANPFLSLLIPFAATHELLLQCILALSGVHFINQVNGTASFDIMATTWTHYALAIRGLKHGITRIAYGEQEILPLLMATLVLCFVEVRPSR